ncbi:isocitrate/isopropylmalate dehydrogenase [Variovorax guangxiensis]|nr:isocitrate/isopropylmalate dehydrogenase [Variovorax guangxiensis]
MEKNYRVAVLPGDGIGPEVMHVAQAVLEAVQPRMGRALTLEWLPAGAQHYLDSGAALPEATLRQCESADAILFGAMGLPHVRGADGTEIIPQLDLRMHFDLYAGVRPIRTFRGLPTPLSNPKAEQSDLVLVRESTEGLFYARGRGDAGAMKKCSTRCASRVTAPRASASSRSASPRAGQSALGVRSA